MNKRILLEEELAEKSKYIRINIPDSIPFTIDLKTHKILGWHSIDDNKDIYVKARDEGKYSLLDENQKEIYRIEGYVPNRFLPEKDDFGDYLTLKIDENGKVLNWYRKPDFNEFIKDGYCTIPVTSRENIEKVIDCFIRPFLLIARKKLIFPETKYALCYGVHSVLSFYSDKKQEVYQISEQEACDKRNYKKLLDRVKSVWIYFTIQFVHDFCPLKQTLFFTIDTCIEFCEEHYVVHALHKKFNYDEYPSEDESDKILSLFSENYLKGISTKESYLNLIID